VWQELRTELHPQGLEVVTVALDVDPEAARPFIEAAKPEHPSLIDQAHVLDERFGVVNVPNGLWIDEDGVIVRPAEPAFPGRNPVLEQLREVDITTLPEETAAMLAEARKIKTDPEGYLAMLQDWVELGASSRFALSPDEVVRRSQPRDADEARAAAEFELGQHFERAGDHAAAIPHWRAAHRLYPDNWTYKRQAWELEDPMRQGHTDAYDGSWYEDVVQIGAENYYPPITP
jgi:hypothetical protein